MKQILTVALMIFLVSPFTLLRANDELEIGRVYTLEELNGLLPEGVLEDFEQVREGRPVMALTGRLVDNGRWIQYPIMRIGRTQIKLGVSREGTYYEDLTDNLGYQTLAGQDANDELVADVRTGEAFLVFVALENPDGEENRGIADHPMTDEDGNEYTPSAVVECLANENCPRLQTHFASNNSDPYATLAVEGFLVNLRQSSRVTAENTEQPENNSLMETAGLDLNVIYSPAELQTLLPEAVWGRVEARMTELGNISFVGMMVTIEDFGDIARGQSGGIAPRVNINRRAVFIMGIFPELIRSIDASSETATFTDIGAQSLGVEAQRYISEDEAFLLIIPVEPNGDSEVFNNQLDDVDFQGNFRDGSRISYRDTLDLILSGQGDEVETVDSPTGDPAVYVSMMIFNLLQFSQVMPESTETPENNDTNSETEGINPDVMYNPVELQALLPEAVWDRVEARMTELGNISFLGAMVTMNSFGEVDGFVPSVNMNGRNVFISGTFPELIRSVDASQINAPFTDIGAQHLGTEARVHLEDGEAFLLILPVEPNTSDEAFNGQIDDIEDPNNERDGEPISYRDTIEAIMNGTSQGIGLPEAPNGDPIVEVSMMIFNLSPESPQ